MAFAAVPPSPQSPAASSVGAGAWWPSIDCNAARDVLRLGDIVTHARLVAALSGALVTVTGELAAWRAEQEAAGKASLAAVAPADIIGTVTRLEMLFTRAVRFYAAAELDELNRGVGSTNEALTRADAEIRTAVHYNQMALHAVRDIIGTTRTAVELI